MALLSVTTICRRCSCLASDIEKVKASNNPSRARLASPNLFCEPSDPFRGWRHPTHHPAAQAASIAAATPAAVTHASVSARKVFTSHTPHPGDGQTATRLRGPAGEQAPRVPGDHQFLVRRDHPGRDAALRTADATCSRLVGFVVEFQAEPGGVAADACADGR